LCVCERETVRVYERVIERVRVCVCVCVCVDMTKKERKRESACVAEDDVKCV
jgi:hypothetical protein